MFPQAELENYKLQVELLQEKLRRSEDNRHQLEHKLDKVLQKRSELEKSVRHKTRQAYHDFLEEQAQRNERNKRLVHMLERIDEQTAAMSQRSERLKMMKLQYQMYFAKLVQNQTLRCIHQTTNAGGTQTTLPYQVLLQPQATLLSNPTNTAGSAAPAANQPLNLNPNQNQPLLYPMPATATPQQWAFATPTPAGMLLASQVTPQQVYMPYPDLYGGAGQSIGNSNLFDLRATLRALDNENADLPERMSRFDKAALPAGDTEKVNSDRTIATPTTSTTTTPATMTTTGIPCSTQDRNARELSSTSPTTLVTSSSLTFDKLPNTATMTELPTAAVAVAGSLPAGGNELRRGSQQAAGVELDDWMPNLRVTKNEHEKSPSVAGHNEPGRQPQQQQQQRQPNIEAYFGELKIDEPWQRVATSTTIKQRPGDQFEDRMEVNVRAGEMKSVGGGNILVGGISNSDLLDEVKASRAALQKAAAAVDEQLARGNQLSPPATINEPYSKPRVSIENIENAIYGERLTVAPTTAISARTAATAAVTEVAATTSTQGLFENVANNAMHPQQQHQSEQQQNELEPLQLQQLPEEQQQLTTHDASQIDYGPYDANSSYVDHNDPSYASIESRQQQQQQLPQQTSVAGEPLYTEIGNPQDDYQQYATDANVAAAPVVETNVDAEAAVQQQQEYSNMDYSNYDAAQYAAAGGYDPNAYPGYIYDETTGQYIADPNAAQYAPDGSYAGQEYDAGVTNYDYYGEQQEQPQQQAEQEQQQQQQEQQEAAAYSMADNNSSGLATEQPQEVEQGTPPADVIPPPVPAAKAAPVKPTSILASTDKQATPNDAHQQQQQQKKKKRVNFVDSSETDDSSSAKPAQEPSSAPPTAVPPTGAAIAASGAGAGSESDFDFSTGSEAKN
ncbi:RNA polymerase II degradation factor 1 [Drosophila grimshawi]|uniref:GH23789 n=1 Tax=Drosophila grimshawi TaxID=7222 RepID=B4JTE0_DROGR|nr:RNA polymerase II degradation factor 1 [Drosophila grimshawi]EDV95030.1 GH23789 [Drosophila grimshawi]